MLATINREYHTGDVGGRCQKQGSRCDILGGAPALEQCALRWPTLMIVLPVIGWQHRAGSDAVHAHVGSKFACECGSECGDAALAHEVRRIVAPWPMDTDVCDVDDRTPTLSQHRRSPLCHKEHAAQIGVVKGIPLLDGDRPQGRCAPDTRIVHHHIERSGKLEGCIDDPLSAGHVGQIARDHRSASAAQSMATA